MLFYEYIDNKKKETILLLHAYGGNHRCFKKQIDDLSDMFNILQIDLPGHGNSRDLHIYDLVDEDIESVILEINEIVNYLEIEKFHIMALSLGTMIANVYLLKHPERVSSILNVGAILQFNKASTYFLKFIYKFRKLIPKTLFYIFSGFIIMPRVEHIKSRSIFIKEASKMNSKDFYSWLNIMTRFQEKYDLLGMKNTCNDIPILYVSGEYDYLFKSAIEKYCIKSKDKCEFRVIEHAGHVCNIERAVEFNLIMNEFYNYSCVIDFL